MTSASVVHPFAELRPYNDRKMTSSLQEFHLSANFFFLFVCQVQTTFGKEIVFVVPGGRGTQLCDCILPEIINFCPQRDLSRHRTLMQNKAVNSKCQLITVGTLPTSRCVPYGFFYLKQKTQRAEECIFLYFRKEKPHQTRQGG